MANNKTIVHVVGTGTIGEPLIGLFNQFRDAWSIDEVTFHKRTPNAADRAKVNQLIAHGARLVTDEEARDDFAELGHRVSYTAEEAIRTCRLARELGMGDMVKLEVIGDQQTLFPDGAGTLEAARVPA